jgi:hypothetical protein
VATLLGFNYYPPTEGLWKAGDAFRLHGHADYNLITLLYRRAGEPGLELLPGKEAVADPRVKNQVTAYKPCSRVLEVMPMQPLPAHKLLLDREAVADPRSNVQVLCTPKVSNCIQYTAKTLWVNAQQCGALNIGPIGMEHGYKHISAVSTQSLNTTLRVRL